MNKKVLLADDDEIVLELVAATLGNDERYSLLLARNGEEALALIQREKPELVFLDIMMTPRDGYAVCRAVKRNPDTAHIKVVMLTALAQETERRRALEEGADGYFTKPFSPTALLEKVEEILALR